MSAEYQSENKMKRNLPKNRIYAALAVAVSLALIFGVYTMQFHVPDREDALIAAAEEYMGFDIEAKDFVRRGNGMLLTFVASSKVDSDGETIGGTVTFQRGPNRFWSPISASYGGQGMYIDTATLSDYRLFGAKEYLVCYGLFCPDNFGSYEMGYYDEAAYAADGSIVEKTLTGEITDTHFANVHPAVSFHYLKRDIRIFDKEGKELTGNGTYRDDGTEDGEEHDANWIPGANHHGGTGISTAELDLLNGFSGILPIIGLVTARYFWKQK